MIQAHRILIVDDDVELAAMLRAVFDLKGYEPLVAHSAAQVVALLGNDEYWPVSLILLDLMMPEVDGSELYNWLRAHPKTVDTPVVVLSALDSLEKRVELLNKGADDYLVKPCPPEELLARVAIHIHLHETREAHRAAQTRSHWQTNYINAIDLVAQYTIQHTDNMEIMLQKVCQAVTKYFQGTQSHIYLPDPITQVLDVRVSFPEDVPPASAALPFIKRVALQKTTVNSNLMFGVPFLHDNDLLGVLLLQVKDVPAWPSLTRQALSVLGRQLGLALINAQLLKKAQSPEVQRPLPVPTEPVLPSANMYDPLQTVYSCLQLLTEFEMSREKQLEYLNDASEEIGNLLARVAQVVDE